MFDLNWDIQWHLYLILRDADEMIEWKAKWRHTKEAELFPESHKLSETGK